MSTAALYAPTRIWQPSSWLEPNPGVGLVFNRNTPPVRQAASWTCSCASLAWVMNALGVEAPAGGAWDEWTGVSELRRVAGDSAVSPDYGLARASGVDLESVYADYGYVVQRGLVSWAELAYLSENYIGQLGGARWYHWTGVRGYDGLAFNLANPAPRWKGVGDDLDSTEWNYWGVWNALMIVGVR